ncbi:MAG: PAS domain-containing protein, partial [Hyphomicrobium sp.]
MSESEAGMPGAAMAVDLTVRARDASRSRPALLIAALFAVSAVVLFLVASGAREPLLLTVLSALAMAGMFFGFAVVAGHVRLGERVRDNDLIRLLVDGLPDGAVLTTIDGSVLFANQSYMDVVGRPQDGQPVGLDTALAGDPTAVSALYRLNRAIAMGESRSEELSIAPRSPRGRRTVRVTARRLDHPSLERDIGPLVLWTLADVTEEKARETERFDLLKEQIAGYERLPVGLVTVGADGLIRQMNAAFSGWIGVDTAVSRDRGLRLADLVSPDGAELLRSAARRSGEPATGFDLAVTASNGLLVPMRFFVAGRPAGGKVGDTGSEILLAAHNRRTEEAAAAGDDTIDVRFASFFQSAPFGIATVAADGRIATANAAFMRMIVDGSRGVGQPAIDVLVRSETDEARAEVATGLKHVLSGRAHATPIEITVGRKGEFSRRVYMSPLIRSGEAREAAILYVLDATEQKALESKFAQSSKMEAVGKLAGGIAHDFNNVLTAIIGFSDLLLQTHRPADPAYKDIANIRSSAVRAAGLVAKLLAFSRRQTLQTEPLQLGEVLTDLAPLLKRSIGEKIELKIPTGRDLWYVKADKTQFEQVVINLAVNARDAMPDGGSLTIRTRNITER